MAQILRVRAACCDITAVRYSPPPARPPNSTRSTGNAVLGVDIYRLLVLDTVYGRAARLRNEGAGLWWWSGGSRSDERHNTLYIHKCEWSSVPGFLVLHSTHIPLPYHKSRMKRLSAAGAQTHMNALMTRSNEHTTDKKTRRCCCDAGTGRHILEGPAQTKLRVVVRRPRAAGTPRFAEEVRLSSDAPHIIDAPISHGRISIWLTLPCFPLRKSCMKH